MGLDMYLRARKYVGGWSHSEKCNYEAIKNLVGVEGINCKDSPSLTVSVNVAYWRKANAIHRWFVQNVQEGEDLCRPHSVSTKQLTALIKLCKRVIKDPDLAPELLPTQDGFFFGGTEYDDDYMSDLKLTVEQLEPLITNPAFTDFEFEYQSSW